MKKALVSSIEFVQSGFRIAQVESSENIFPVADDLFWVDCDDSVVADLYFYDPKTKTIKETQT